MLEFLDNESTGDGVGDEILSEQELADLGSLQDESIGEDLEVVYSALGYLDPTLALVLVNLVDKDIISRSEAREALGLPTEA